MASLAVKYSVTVEELAKTLHTLKSQLRLKHKKLTVSKKNGTSPKSVPGSVTSHSCFCYQ